MELISAKIMKMVTQKGIRNVGKKGNVPRKGTDFNYIYTVLFLKVECGYTETFVGLFFILYNFNLS